MDKLNVNGRRRSDRQRDDLRVWLQENGRVPRRRDDGTFDPGDCTLTDERSRDGAPSVDVSVTRDEATCQIRFTVIANYGDRNAPIRYERRIHQMDHPPTPFPESLAEFVVTV